MPLQGNIRDFSTTQLLNLINLAGKTGILTIFEAVPTGEKDAMQQEKMAAGKERATVAFKSGKLIHARMIDQESSLTAVLNKAGKLTDEQARIVRERAQGASDKRLAMLLISANYVTQADIVSSIQQFMLDVVYNLMSWTQGPFRFDDNSLPDKEHILVPVDLENVIIEGTRRRREVDELTKAIPSLDMALKFPENPKEKFQGIHLSVEEWRVVSFVNPKNTIRQIMKANNMSEIEIRRVVYGLEQAGLVELIKPAVAAGAGAKDGSTAPRQRPKPKQQVQQDVVKRLIDKIRSI